MQHVQTVKQSSLDSTVITTDTSRIHTITTNQVQTIFGDTLTGSLQFTDEQVSGMEAAGEAEPPADDSLESGGIKVKISFKKNKAGGYKASVKAVAKPVQVVSTSTVTSDEKKGLTTAASMQKTEQVSVTSTDKKIVGWPWYLKLVLWGGLAIGISFFIYYKIKNYG